MLKIIGKFNTAICYTDKIEPAAYAQIESVCNEEAFKNSKIRIMPDVHVGKGCMIGTTMTFVDKVVPNMVGVDIGCSMYTAALGKSRIDLEEFDKAAHSIPCGRSVWEGRQERCDLTQLCCYRNLKLPSAVSISEKFLRCISELPTAQEKIIRKNSSARSRPSSEEYFAIILPQRS